MIVTVENVPATTRVSIRSREALELVVTDPCHYAVYHVRSVLSVADPEHYATLQKCHEHVYMAPLRRPLSTIQAESAVCSSLASRSMISSDV